MTPEVSAGGAAADAVDAVGGATVDAVGGATADAVGGATVDAVGGATADAADEVRSVRHHLFISDLDHSCLKMSYKCVESYCGMKSYSQR